MRIELTIDDYGTKYWTRNGVYHREYDPAIIYSDGAKFWYLEGDEIDSYFPEDCDEIL